MKVSRSTQMVIYETWNKLHPTPSKDMKDDDTSRTYDTNPIINIIFINIIPYQHEVPHSNRATNTYTLRNFAISRIFNRYSQRTVPPQFNYYHYSKGTTMFGPLSSGTTVHCSYTVHVTLTVVILANS